MEKLLHYAWLHRLLPPEGLLTEDGERVEVVDPGVLNTDAGPDFTGAKVRIGSTLWAGGVEMHLRASDWARHGHQADAAYEGVVLHVCAQLDAAATTASGRRLPQTVLPVPEAVRQHYDELMAEAAYPPCYRVIPSIPPVVAHAWMAALAAERLELKTQRIASCLERTGGDWERAYFITLARSFGFGLNAEAFEQWAWHIDLSATGKHRDDLLQVEAIFLGQAGLLEAAPAEGADADDYYARLQREYRYLAHKFGMQPMAAAQWRFLRLRPQNFPTIRLAQLAALFHQGALSFARLLDATTPRQVMALFAGEAQGYWAEHYTFASAHTPRPAKVAATAQALVLINTAAPMLFAYGLLRHDEARREHALALLEGAEAESNAVTRQWQRAGLTATNAADSQALLQLRRQYCDRRDCLRCRFGSEYLRQGRHSVV